MTISDRMKEYERQALIRAMPLLPICARIDGRGFHRWTHGLDRPYDVDFMHAMGVVTDFLVRETGAKVGYTQSDEISLIYYSDNILSQVFFDGKTQKMISILASMATAKFNEVRRGSKLVTRPLAFFDCRVWQVPTLVEATNVLVWREHDCLRNSVFSAAREYYSHTELLGKNTNQLQDMLFSKGVNWNDYPTRFKRGLYIARRVVDRSFSLDELIRIPTKHRPQPGAIVRRTEIAPLDIPPICGIMNRVGVFFHGEAPKTE